MQKYRVLSLDGGGIRGLLTTVLLERLEAAIPGWLDQIDLVAGTSTGGIIALGLAHGMSPSDLRSLYYDRSDQIFKDSFLDDIFDWGNAVGAEYRTGPLRRELTNVLGGVRLGDLQKKVLIPAFDLDNWDEDERAKPRDERTPRTWKPKFFHNYDGADSDSDKFAVDVALYTSAAPSYFPSVDGFIDGGVVANNPSMSALAQARDCRCDEKQRELDEIYLLSLGTGRALRHLPNKAYDWGWTQWARPILDVMMDGLLGVPDYQCQQMLGDTQYHRLNPLLSDPIRLDDLTVLDELVDVANSADLAPTIAWIQQNWTPDQINLGYD